MSRQALILAQYCGAMSTIRSVPTYLEYARSQTGVDGVTSVKIRTSTSRRVGLGSFRRNTGMFNTLPKHTLAMVVAFVTLATIVVFASHDARVVDAQSGQSETVGFTLVAFDTSLSQIEDIEAAGLAAKMVLSDADEGLILVGQYADHAREPQSFATGDLAKAAVDEAIDVMKSRIGDEPTPAELSEMLESYASYVEQLGENGRLYILSSGRFTFHESSGVGGLEAVASDLAASGVTINTISLATTPSPDRDVLSLISSAGGGTAYDLGFLDGVLEFINGELGVVLTPTLQTDSSGSAGETVDVGVPPHSSYLVAGYSFEDSETLNVIRQPNGQEIADSVGSVNAFSISGMKFFTVRNPQPGVWSLKSAVGSGPLTIYSDVVNNIGVVMELQPPFPIREPFILTVDAQSGELPLIDSSAIVDAFITGPDGAEITYELNDLGEDGDAFGEDGVFSATVAAQELVGVSNVRFSMRWPNLAPTIDGEGVFFVAPFPTIEIEIVGDGSVVSGARSHLATVDLKIADDALSTDAAFLAAQEDIEISIVNADDGMAVDIELEPTEIVEEKVYQVMVFGALTLDGDYVVNAKLNSVHRERRFEALAVEQTASIEVTNPVSIPLLAGLGVAAFIGFLILLLLLRALFQSTPYGSLYRVDSQGERELVANFREYNRSPWDWLMNKPIVPAAAMPGVPLLGGRFVFNSRGIAFRYRPDSDGLLRMTIRGEPLQPGNTSIVDGEEFQISSETFVFDRAAIGEGVRVSERLTGSQRPRHEDLDNFALDPMTWDAPASARPTRRRY